MTLQLELPFILEDPDMKVNRAIEHIETRFERNRKSLHVKVSNQQSKIDQLEHEFEMIKAMICKGQLEFKF